MLSYVVSNRPCTNDLAALLHLFYDLCSSPIPNREMALMGLTDETITRPPPFHLARSLFSSREKVELEREVKAHCAERRVRRLPTDDCRRTEQYINN